MKTILYSAGIALIVILSFLFLSSNSSSAISGNTISETDVQIVKIHVEGSEYVFEPSTVKKGVTVKLEADMSRMPGCSRSIISTELGIKKTFSSKDNTLIFNPSKAGTFYIACSMNMYKGKLTVLESDGTKSNYIETPKAGGHTCGGSAGGCGGCGG